VASILLVARRGDAARIVRNTLRDIGPVYVHDGLAVPAIRRLIREPAGHDFDHRIVEAFLDVAAEADPADELARDVA
jgi:hypothetical protein